jgi:hypothetical protein
MGGGSGSGGNASTGGAASTGGVANTGGSLVSGGNANTAGGSSSGGTAGASAGGAGAGGNSSEGPGTITDLWRGFCVATFAEDYQVVDPFGASLFTARAGEEYLLISYPAPYASATLAYLTSTGPYEFKVAPNADNTAYPFTTDCPTDLEAASYFAVFADVTVYAEAGLVTPICELAAGTALARDSASSAGFGLESFGDGVSVYEIFLNAFSAQCGGAASGYISVPGIQLFGSGHVVVPFRVITAPI